MKYFFRITDQFVSEKAKASIDEKSAETLSSFFKTAAFSTQEEYDQFLTNLTQITEKLPLKSSTASQYQEEMGLRTRKIPLIEPTPWGLVSIKIVNVVKDLIQKLLVIKKHGILGFEYHEKKHEKLDIFEGIAIIIWANHASTGWTEGQITAQIATVGDKFEFMPLDEHGMIALTDAVINETSTNHLDDLLFIFDSKQVVTI